MTKNPFFACLLMCLIAAAPAAAADLEPLKEGAVAAVDAHGAELIGLADQIWAFAEPALRETRSAALLEQYLESEGFAVERGVAGLPTAFVATYGEGRPIIGILGEYDALPGISQRAQPTQEALVARGGRPRLRPQSARHRRRRCGAGDQGTHRGR